MTRQYVSDSPKISVRELKKATAHAGQLRNEIAALAGTATQVDSPGSAQTKATPSRLSDLVAEDSTPVTRANAILAAARDAVRKNISQPASGGGKVSSLQPHDSPNMESFEGRLARLAAVGSKLQEQVNHYHEVRDTPPAVPRDRPPAAPADGRVVSPEGTIIVIGGERGMAPYTADVDDGSSPATGEPADVSPVAGLVEEAGNSSAQRQPDGAVSTDKENSVNHSGGGPGAGAGLGAAADGGPPSNLVALNLGLNGLNFGSSKPDKVAHKLKGSTTQVPKRTRMAPRKKAPEAPRLPEPVPQQRRPLVSRAAFMQHLAEVNLVAQDNNRRRVLAERQLAQQKTDPEGWRSCLAVAGTKQPANVERFKGRSRSAPVLPRTHKPPEASKQAPESKTSSRYSSPKRANVREVKLSLDDLKAEAAHIKTPVAHVTINLDRIMKSPKRSSMIRRATSAPAVRPLESPYRASWGGGPGPTPKQTAEIEEAKKAETIQWDKLQFKVVAGGDDAADVAAARGEQTPEPYGRRLYTVPTPTTEDGYDGKQQTVEDLDAAMQEIIDSLEKLSQLTRADMTVLRTMRHPPRGVRLVVISVCKLIKLQPRRIPDPESKQRFVDDLWYPAKNLMGNIDEFRTKVANADVYSVDRDTAFRVKRMLDDEMSQPELMATCSKAAHVLCLWARAVISHYMTSLSLHTGVPLEGLRYPTPSTKTPTRDAARLRESEIDAAIFTPITPQDTPRSGAAAFFVPSPTSTSDSSPSARRHTPTSTRSPKQKSPAMSRGATPPSWDQQDTPAGKSATSGSVSRSEEPQSGGGDQRPARGEAGSGSAVAAARPASTTAGPPRDAGASGAAWPPARARRDTLGQALSKPGPCPQVERRQQERPSAPGRARGDTLDQVLGTPSQETLASAPADTVGPGQSTADKKRGLPRPDSTPVDPSPVRRKPNSGGKEVDEKSGNRTATTPEAGGGEAAATPMQATPQQPPATPATPLSREELLDIKRKNIRVEMQRRFDTKKEELQKGAKSQQVDGSSAAKSEPAPAAAAAAQPAPGAAAERAISSPSEETHVGGGRTALEAGPSASDAKPDEASRVPGREAAGSEVAAKVAAIESGTLAPDNVSTPVETAGSREEELRKRKRQEMREELQRRSAARREQQKRSLVIESDDEESHSLASNTPQSLAANTPQAVGGGGGTPEAWGSAGRPEAGPGPATPDLPPPRAQDNVDAIWDEIESLADVELQRQPASAAPVEERRVASSSSQPRLAQGSFGEQMVMSIAEADASEGEENPSPLRGPAAGAVKKERRATGFVTSEHGLHRGPAAYSETMVSAIAEAEREDPEEDPRTEGRAERAGTGFVQDGHGREVRSAAEAPGMFALREEDEEGDLALVVPPDGGKPLLEPAPAHTRLRVLCLRCVPELELAHPKKWLAHMMQETQIVMDKGDGRKPKLVAVKVAGGEMKLSYKTRWWGSKVVAVTGVMVAATPLAHLQERTITLVTSAGDISLYPPSDQQYVTWIWALNCALWEAAAGLASLDCVKSRNYQNMPWHDCLGIISSESARQ